jgi:hypothetical protein
VCASVVVMLDTQFSEVVRRVLSTHSIRQFPLHLPSCASPCAITFQLDSTIGPVLFNLHISNCSIEITLLLLLLLLLLLSSSSSSSSSLSPLCRVLIHIFLKQCPWGIHCCSYSVVTVYGAYISSSRVGSTVLLC